MPYISSVVKIEMSYNKFVFSSMENTLSVLQASWANIKNTVHTEPLAAEPLSNNNYTWEA